MKEKLLFDVKYVNESYNVLNRSVNSLQKTNSEREDALTMMNVVMMSKQKAINHYIEECAKLKQELETEKIENERIRRLLQSYSSSDYLIDRIYPTVAGFEVFKTRRWKIRILVLDKDEESESKSESECSSSSSVDSPKPSVKRVYNKEFLLSKSNLNDETFEVAYTLNDSDKLYSDKEFPIRSVQMEKIQKVFKLTEINISEIKDVNLTEKPKKYTSRVQQRLNKKKGYSSGSGFQKKPNHNSNFKKKGLGFIPPENHKNEKISKTKTVFVSGSSSEEEEKNSFWKQSNKEFFVEKQKYEKNGANKKRETRTCYRCQEVGHIAWNCPMATNTKQEVVSKLKEKIVDKTEPPTEKFKVFKNSAFEAGESSKRFYKRRVNLNNQTWVVKKSDVKFGDEYDSLKLEEPHVELKSEKSVPPMDDVNFPPLRAENLKSKVGKVEISNQFYSEKKEFDVEKAFNGKVKNIFGKMVEGKAKVVKEFYEIKRNVQTPSETEKVTPKAGQAWVSVFFT
ncbi:putative transcription factor interactor and regulator CCHC(Zn) family [Helianthus annuus]|uniref:Transcription factor interactor and regulator CCHC(Zn) family n=1 Tax=Helianthus annuus TaxID=4232 RepID=A0A9K3JUZ8_HELAN|nr:putative transcription factor interactor and regulator CCHC(Zn) family [Helianthus annuus]